MIKPEFFVIHTAAFAVNGIPQDCGADRIRDWHLERGWQDIGYHFVIRMDGDLEKGRSLTLQGAHVLGLNNKSIGVCCAGHGDIADFTDDQKDALKLLYKQLGGDLKIIGHREANKYVDPQYHTSKTCPGTKVDMDEIRAFILETPIKEKKQDMEKIKRFQAYLQSEGYYMGLIDGIPGIKTQEAIEKLIKEFKDV